MAVLDLLVVPSNIPDYQEMTICGDVLGVIDRANLNATVYVENLDTKYCVHVWGCGLDTKTCAPRKGIVTKRIMENCTLFCEVSR